MSMLCRLRRVSAKDLARLQSDSSLCEAFLSEDDIDGFDPFEDLDVDKAWHGIHHPITGSVWEGAPPLNFLVLGGNPIGEDLRYGPPRGFSPADVKTIAAALSTVTADWLRSRYDPNEMQHQDVYTGIWVREGGEGFTFLLNYFEALKQFVLGASEKGEAIVVFLS